MVKKDLLRLATVNVGALSGWSREVRYWDQGTRVYGGEEKYMFWWGDQRKTERTQGSW